MGQAAQLGQQGSDNGQYGPAADTSAYPQSPYRQDGNSPYAPMGQQTDNYFGMYPKGQPSFGSNPYTPQTANIAGQPGDVKTMATGGASDGGVKRFNGPLNANTTSQQTPDQAINAMFSSKGLGQPQPTNANMKAPGVIGVMGQNNPEFMTAMGKGPAEKQQEVVQQVANAPQVYAPKYAQYAPVRPNLDENGIPLFNSGGSIRR